MFLVTRGYKGLPGVTRTYQDLPRGCRRRDMAGGKKVLLLDTIGYYLILVDTGCWQKPDVRAQRSECRFLLPAGGVFEP